MVMKQSYLLLGPFKLYFYGFSIFLAVALSYWWTRKRAAQYDLYSQVVEEIFLSLIPVSIIGARLYHVLSWFSYYRMFPLEIFFLWQGGLGIYGAIILGVSFVYLFCKIKKTNFFKLLDLMSPSALICQSIGRLGNYFNQEVFGPPTSLPWRIFIPPDKRPVQYLNKSFFHPTFLYESILLFSAFLIINWIEKNKKIKNGQIFSLYLIFYGTIRFSTEFLRFDTWQVQGIKVAQIMSLFFIFMGMGIYLWFRGIRSKKLVK